MAFPKVNLPAANAIFSALNIEFQQHELGYYVAEVKGQEIKNARLIDLTHDVLKAIAQ